MEYLANGGRYGSMRYNRVGRSGLKLPALSLGLWQNFGDGAPLNDARGMLLYAFDRGVTHFDLANNYGPAPGSAEEAFGRVIGRELAPYRDEIVVSTKAGYRMWPGPYGEWGSKKSLVASLDQSLRRMGLDYVDIFYHHRPDPETPLEETMDALSGIVRSGKALYAGVSNYPPEDARRAHALLARMGVRLLVHQPRYSMLARGAEAVFDALDELGMGAAVFSPLAQGLLTDRYLNGIPRDSRAGGPSAFLKPEQVTDAVVLKARRLNEIAAARGQTLAQMALAWVLRRPTVATVLMGASRLSQIEDNLKALQNLAWTEDELARIGEILEG